jgi:hypothetical protein
LAQAAQSRTGNPIETRIVSLPVFPAQFAAGRVVS